MWQKIKIFIANIPVIKQLLYLSKQLSFPGFSHVPIYYVGSFFVKGLFKGDINQRSAALAFTFFLALFPLIISFFTLIPYIPIENFQSILLNTLSEIIPAATWDVIETIITDIVSRPRGGLLSISFISALFLATNGMMAISTAFNNSYHGIKSRKSFKQRMISFLLVIILSLLMVLAIVLIISGKVLVNYLVDNDLLRSGFAIWMLIIGKWLIVMALIFFAISFIYFLAPSNQKYYRFISAGSTLATTMAALLLIGFDAYVTNFTHYNVLYGSIGTLIVMMVWIYFNSMVLLIGFELNVSIYKAKLNFKKKS